MPGDVSVYVRIRPPLAGEPREAAATVLNKETVRLEVARTATVCEHGCDAAFGPQASQAELFDGVARDVVDAVLAGVDGTVVAYGQTGAGKSHTLGVLEAPDHVERARDGVVPRALRRLFAARPGEVVMSFLEIYDERVRDLLAPPRDAAEVERRRHDEAFSAKAPRPADIVEGLPVRENTRGGFEVEGRADPLDAFEALAHADAKIPAIEADVEEDPRSCVGACTADHLDEAQIDAEIVARGQGGAYDSVVGLTTANGGSLEHEENVLYEEAAAIPSYLIVYKLP